MNNKLSENLKKIRKDNNISQEQLAEELGVSRQAISKWESGIAYPEMEKIMQLCDKFDLNIDDLLHRDIHELKGEEISKGNLNKYIDDFLNFITDTVSLFSNMNFKSKIKCIFEQIVIAIILLIIFSVIGTLGLFIMDIVFNSILPYEMYRKIQNLLAGIYLILAIVISFIVIIHIFKTRYLDYYSKLKKDFKNSENNHIDNNEKIESNNEENINKTNKILFRQNENKIIIRDPNHSEYKFINGLFKLIILGVKFFAILATIFLCFILICLFASLISSLIIIKTGILFIGIFIGLLSAGIIDITLILLLFNFIFNRKNDKKKMISSFIISTIILGISLGFIFIGSLSFDVINKRNNEMLVTRSNEFDMYDGLFLHNYNEIEYIEKDIDNVKIEYKINKICNSDYYQDDEYGIYIWGDCTNPMQLLREYIKNINNKKIIDINNNIYDIKVYASKENLEIIKNNYENVINKR